MSASGKPPALRIAVAGASGRMGKMLIEAIGAAQLRVPNIGTIPLLPTEHMQSEFRAMQQ